MKGLILAGGLATRLRPLSHTGPKQLIPVANKPVLHYIMEDLVSAGITDIGIIVGYTKERIKYITDSIQDGSKWGAKVTYIEQDAPRGLAHAVGIAKEYIKDEPFVVYLGDNMLKEGIIAHVEEFKLNKPDASIMLCHVQTPEKYGVAIVKGEEIIDVEEKPEKPTSNLAIVGVYIFTKEIFKAIEKVKPGKKGELQLTDAIKLMITNSDLRVTAHIIKGWWDDTGTTDAILNANRMMLLDLQHSIKGNLDPGVKISGTANIGKGTKIEKGTTISGPVIIGENCQIGPNTYIGPYTSIGDQSHIKGCEIESSIILSKVTIDFKHKIVNSLIGKYARVISDESLPKGHKLILGEHCEVKL